MRMTTEDVVRAVRQLPVMSRALCDLLALLDRPDADLGSVVDSVGRDPALAARVLRIANSSFYGLSGQIACIRDAVRLLGLASLHRLALAAGLMQHLALPRDNPFDSHAFWRRSIGAAVCAQELAGRTGQEAECAFTVGLLHDIGQLAIALACPPAVAQAQVLWRVPLATGDEERSLLGTDHSTVGAELARLWNLPRTIQSAIEGHHDPDRFPGSPLADLVHLAATFAAAAAAEREADASQPSPGSLMRLGLTADAFAQACASLDARVQSTTAALVGGAPDAGGER